jgi:hypothetical protein
MRSFVLDSDSECFCFRDSVSPFMKVIFVHNFSISSFDHYFRTMADDRKRESGRRYKKLREEKEEKEAELLKKVPKIETFFTPKHKADNPGTYVRSTIFKKLFYF